MTVYLFGGPSLSVIEPMDQVVILPPIQHGDLLRLDLSSHDVVAIVDGFFYGRPAVRHREILDAIAQGVPVVGGASMGALRAAELDKHGMTGVGTVYELLRDGAVEADADVALLHGDAEHGYQPLSLALVSVRVGCSRLVEQHIVNESRAAELLEVLSGLFFPDRTPQRLIAEAARLGMSSSAIEQLLSCADGSMNDVKARDAAQVLDYARGLAEHQSPNARVAGCPEDDGREADELVSAWLDDIALSGPRTERASDRLVARAVQLAHPDMPVLYEAFVSARLSASWQVPGNEVVREFARRTGREGASTGDVVASYREWPNIVPIDALTRFLKVRTPGWGELSAALASRDVSRSDVTITPSEMDDRLADLWSLPSTHAQGVQHASSMRGFQRVNDVRAVGQSLLCRSDADSLLNRIASTAILGQECSSC